ncbi:hypothetical protein ACXZ66_02005 [Corynebacterium sp. S7]
MRVDDYGNVADGSPESAEQRLFMPVTSRDYRVVMQGEETVEEIGARIYEV